VPVSKKEFECAVADHPESKTDGGVAVKDRFDLGSQLDLIQLANRRLLVRIATRTLPLRERVAVCLR
jgi:hypothetical protein